MSPYRTVAQLTARSLLGRRRTLLLLAIPVVLLALCVLARVLAGFDDGLNQELDSGFATGLLGGFALAVLMPLLGLIAGTGAIGPEIDEGSIVYLLAKPLNRYAIILAKLVVTIGVIMAFGVIPIAIAGIVLTGEVGTVTIAYAIGALVAGVGYAAFFLMLAVVNRNAVVLGLIYALVWESLLGGLAPGAQNLSILQWAMSVVVELLGDRAELFGVDAAVSFSTGLVLLVIVTVAAPAYAGRRLQTLRLNAEV